MRTRDRRHDPDRTRRRERAVLLWTAPVLAAMLAVLALWPSRVPLRAPKAADVMPWSALQPPAGAASGALRPQLASLEDSDPRAAALLRDMQAAADRAPALPELEGRHVALVGYVVPLTRERGATTELLLVPYYGACIHSPPPPANQIVHVRAARPVLLDAMDEVLVRGVMHVARAEFARGVSGYRIDAARIDAERPRPAAWP